MEEEIPREVTPYGAANAGTAQRRIAGPITGWGQRSEEHRSSIVLIRSSSAISRRRNASTTGRADNPASTVWAPVATHPPASSQHRVSVSDALPPHALADRTDRGRGRRNTFGLYLYERIEPARLGGAEEPMPFDYEFNLRIRAPRPVVFERLLRIEHLSRWFCGWSRIEPKVGGTFKFGGETCIVLPDRMGWETTIDEGEILRRFAFTWPIRSTSTRVSYDLEDATDGATRLRAHHRGVPMRETTCGTTQDAWRMCLGNLKSIAEGRSDSVRPDHAPVTAPELRLTVLVEAPPPRVFEALTNPSHVDHWSTGGVPAGLARVEARAGGTFDFGWPEGPNRILEIATGRRLSLGWPKGEGNLRVTLDLEEKASGTAIYLSSTGFSAHQLEEILRHRGRWSDLLVCLKNYVEGGDSGFENRYEAQVQER